MKSLCSLAVGLFVIAFVFQTYSRGFSSAIGALVILLAATVIVVITYVGTFAPAWQKTIFLVWAIVCATVVSISSYAAYFDSSKSSELILDALAIFTSSLLLKAAVKPHGAGSDFS